MAFDLDINAKQPKLDTTNVTCTKELEYHYLDNETEGIYYLSFGSCFVNLVATNNHYFTLTKSGQNPQSDSVVSIDYKTGELRINATNDP